MEKNSVYNKYTFSNIFKLIFFIAFIDFILFSLHRLSINFESTDIFFNSIYLSEFSFFNYILLFLSCLFVFFLTMLITMAFPRNTFKIRIKKKSLYFLLTLFFCLSFYLYITQLNYSVRHEGKTTLQLSGIALELSSYLSLIIFLIYQLNRNEINFKFFLFFLFCFLLKIDGLGDSLLLISMVAFEYFRFNFKKKLYLFFFILIFVIAIFWLGISQKYAHLDDFYIIEKYGMYFNFFFNSVLPRVAIHSEQLFAYIANDLDISNYQYLLNVIVESYNNRIKIITEGYENLYYPKTVAQSIVYSMQGWGASGGSSPGYVLSVISFLPFNLPLVIILALIFKQFAFRLNKNITLIQVACLCYIFKGISADLLEMMSIISPSLIKLVLVFLTVNIYLEKTVSNNKKMNLYK